MYIKVKNGASSSYNKQLCRFIYVLNETSNKLGTDPVTQDLALQSFSIRFVVNEK